MTEIFYEQVRGTENQARSTAINIWQPGVVTASERGIGIHKVANEAQDTLVTLHLYSPPLLEMKFYTAVDDVTDAMLALTDRNSQSQNLRTIT
jgi:hypothetical protein